MIQNIKNFNLDQIAESGQCFRWRKLDEGKYLIPAYDHCVTVSQSGERFEFSCSEEEFNQIWKHYFDLELDYGKIIEAIPADDSFLKEAAAYGRGIRILKQELWEMIISYIISQNNNIPRIKNGIEAVCDKYKAVICKSDNADEENIIYGFPRFEDIEKNGGRQSLSELGLGYRDEYIWLMCTHEANNPNFLCDLRACDYEQSMKVLMEHKGIGKKVANCISLFGLHNLDACPIDVWMKKIIDEEYGGVMPKWMNNRYAGIYQQYTFFFKRKNK